MRDVNLDALLRISWQVRQPVNLGAQISWLIRHFVILGVRKCVLIRVVCVVM